MFVAFAESLYKKLIENEFYITSNKVSDYMLTQDKEVIIMIKKVGTVFYIVNIVNIDKIGLCDYKQRMGDYKNKITDNFQNLDTQYIIILNLLITDNITQDLLSYNDTQKFMPDETIHSIQWIVDLYNNKLITPSDNTNKVLNIHEIIDDIFLKGIDYKSEVVSLKTVEKQINEITALKPKTDTAYFTYNLILINVLVWIFMLFNIDGVNMKEVIMILGAKSSELVIVQKQYWRLITSIFIHGGLIHTISNCFALYIFGIRVERYFGKALFFTIYMASGLFGGIVSILFSPNISIGASGAVYGVIGSILALTYQRNKKVDGFSFYMVLFIAIISITFGFLDPQIGNYAHIGGLIIGYIIGFLFCPEGEKQD